MITGCALRHVTIRGNVTGGLEFLAAGLIQPASEWGALLAANERFYADVDWALDISEARFTSVSFVRSDIPARLIRRISFSLVDEPSRFSGRDGGVIVERRETLWSVTSSSIECVRAGRHLVICRVMLCSLREASLSRHRWNS